jgi:hypothetical protein
MKRNFGQLVGDILKKCVPVLIISSNRVGRASYNKKGDFYVYSNSTVDNGKIALHGPFSKSDKRFRII